jgi:hypothetical protein
MQSLCDSTGYESDGKLIKVVLARISKAAYAAPARDEIPQARRAG